MPQEMLRDVLRAGDADGRSRRRWAIVPVSIAAHAVAVAAVLIIPLAADVPSPAPAEPRDVHWVRPGRPPDPSPPPATSAAETAQPCLAPTQAPPSIEPEPERLPSVAATPGEVVEGAIGSGLGVPTEIGDRLREVPLPPPPPPVKVAPVRIGQGIRTPHKLVDVLPVYPPFAQAARVEGTVVLEAVLDEQGRVDRVRVLKSEPLLDQAAIAAVRQWRYTPTLLNGLPVPVLMTITIQFKLH